MHTIFYSWQSDLDNRTNRGLIQAALERAAKDLRSDEDLAIESTVERDTLHVPGSPDITTTIFNKIRQSSVFVCDVTPINPNSSGKKIPNPNVLIELGYAISELGWNRVLLVLNTAYGSIENLPFDLRQKRIMTFYCDEKSAPAESRNQLRKHLEYALRAILFSDEDGFAPKKTPIHTLSKTTQAAQRSLAAERAQRKTLLTGSKNFTIWKMCEGDDTVYLPLSFRYPVSPSFLAIRWDQFGPRISVYGKGWGAVLHHIDHHTENEPFDPHRLDDYILHVAEHDFEGDNTPEIVIAYGDGMMHLQVDVYQYHPPALWKDAWRQENWTHLGRFDGQSVAWLGRSNIELPYGSQGLFEEHVFVDGKFVKVQ